MIKAFLKFALPVTITGVGGTSALGITSNNQNQPVSSSSTVDNSSSQEQVRDTLSSTPSKVTVTERTHNSENSSLLELQPQQEIDRETSTFHSEFEHTVKELELNKEEQTGNCRVVNGEESVISKLPIDYKYVSFSCRNNGGEESVLTKWNGFFPRNFV